MAKHNQTRLFSRFPTPEKWVLWSLFISMVALLHLSWLRHGELQCLQDFCSHMASWLARAGWVTRGYSLKLQSRNSISTSRFFFLRDEAFLIKPVKQNSSVKASIAIYKWLNFQYACKYLTTQLLVSIILCLDIGNLIMEFHEVSAVLFDLVCRPQLKDS